MSDSTEQEQTVEALRQSQERLTRAQQIGHLGHWDWDIQEQTLLWSDEVYRIFGVDRVFPLSYETIEAMIHPDDRDRNKRYVQELLAAGETIEFEFRIIRPDGGIRHIRQIAEITRDMAGQPTRVFGIMQDITEPRQAEIALRESETRYRNLFENSIMGISQTLPDGRLVAANAAYAQMYGYANPEEMLAEVSNVGQQLYANPQDREEVLRILKTQGVMEPREMAVIRRDGTRFFVLVGAREVRDSEGNLRCYQAERVDITERKQAEEALKQSREQLRALASHWQTAQEKERARVAREVHDEFGQSLTALKIDLAWLAKRLPPDEPVLANKVEDMIALVDSTIQIVRRVATELRPGLLDDLGLVAALEWQAQEFAGRTGIACQVDLGQEALAQALLTLDQDLATAIFRIFQEALTNIARHAEATQVQVTLQQVQNVLILTVRDNGKGMPPNVAADPRALGLLGMRERAIVWQGSVTFETEPGHGTAVTLRVPYLAGKEAFQ